MVAAESASTQPAGCGSDEVIRFGDLSVVPPLPAVRDLSVTLYRFVRLRAPALPATMRSPAALLPRFANLNDEWSPPSESVVPRTTRPRTRRDQRETGTVRWSGRAH